MTMTIDPTVSVIMPIYNAERFVEGAILSVIDQTFDSWELIAIDDGSSDDSFLKALAAANGDRRIQVLRNSMNSGVSYTRNRGISLARGKYIAFLDSDDEWHPEKLKRQITKIEEFGADIGYCSYAIIDAKGKKVRGDYLVPEKVDFDDLLKENCIQCSAMVILSDIVRKFQFTTDFYHEDYILGLQMLHSGYKAVACQEILLNWRYIENSRSFNKWRAARNRWKIYRKFLHLPLLKSMNLFIHYAFAGLRKYSRKY